MKIEIGKTSGFCFGVKRAVNKANYELENKKYKEVYCLGELVHNKSVISKLEEKGLKIVDDMDDAKNICIGRAHGVSKEDCEKSKTMGIELVDLTCPSVLKVHEIASKYVKEGYYIFLLGEKRHPEVVATSSYCGDNYSIIESIDDIEESLGILTNSNLKKLLLIAQTTFSMKKFDELVDIIKKSISKEINMEIKNTICLATEKRQEETKEMSKRVDAMIIIGGKNSSNTNKLYEIAKSNCLNTFFIENKEELNVEEIIKYQNIGIMAGASTPEEDILDVVNYIKNYS